MKNICEKKKYKFRYVREMFRMPPGRRFLRFYIQVCVWYYCLQEGHEGDASITTRITKLMPIH